MANPAPTINQINAFNATQGTTIDFNIIGGTELVRSNRIYIYDLSDNSLICTHLYVSTESIHELPPNTDGSIVYESGKSSADFVNGAQYYAQIQTYTNTVGTEGGSGLSVAKLFWCLVDPSLTISTIPSSISTTSYNVSATYNANTSVVSNIIQQYQFSLYSATGSLLQSSGVVVGSGEQQGTSTTYDISYNFTGLSVGSSYYVVVDVTTTQGMSVTTQSNTFTVSIDTPTLGEATVVNNACDGYISVTSNLSGEYGGSGSGEIVSFETDSENVFTKLQVDLEPVQSGSGTPSPSNVRPISGHDSVDVVHTGVNVWNEEWEIGKYNTTTGEKSPDTQRIRSKNKIPIVPNTTYYAKWGSFGGNYGIVFFYDENEDYITYATPNASTHLFTTPSDARYMTFYVSDLYGTTYNNDISINYPSTDHEYHAYVGNDYTQEIEVTYTPTVQENEPYQFKRTGDVGGDRESIELVGGSVAWNQLVQNGNFESASGWSAAYGDISAANNELTYTVTRLGTDTYFNYVKQPANPNIPAHHKVLAMFDIYALHSRAIYCYLLNYAGNPTARYNVVGGKWNTYAKIIENGTASTKEFQIALNIQESTGFSVGEQEKIKNFVIFDLTQMFGSTVADYIYSLEQSTAGAGVTFFRKLFPKPYYAYNAGELMSVQASSHDMVGFNAWDEEWELGALSATGGNATSSTEIRSKNYIPVVGGQTYYLYCAVASTFNYKFYDADKNFISGAYIGRNNTLLIPNDARYMRFYMGAAYGTTYNNDICINLSWDGERNGEYEPYVEHSYPLDDSLTLRGVPKLANGKLYYDGDIYESDGTVTRKYGIVDLGTLNWTASSGNKFTVPFSQAKYVPNASSALPNWICSKYQVVNYNNQPTDKYLYGINESQIVIKDTTYSDATTFKSAMSGVYLVYELATPTTETAEPFESIQKVTPNYGTEEFVTTTNVPVGNNTQYYTREVYGGTLDLASGVLTITDGYVELDGSNDEDWAFTSGFAYYRGLRNTAKVGAYSVVPNILCDKLETIAYGQSQGKASWITIDNGKDLRIKVDGITDVASARTWLLSNPIQVVYELATPQTYQLTPQQIQTLVGVNNVWSEQGNVELSYHIPITNLLVKRQDVADVSGTWLTLHSQPVTQASDMDFTFIDFTNQYGKTYKYALVPLLTQTQSGVEVEVEGGYTVSDEVQSVFDGVFIADSTGSQKCKANVGYGNVDMNQTVGTITPIGAKYPVVITNSKNQYHNGSISGTIVPDDYYFNGNLSRIDMVNKRNELEQFLTNKRAKIIKDWNGNIWLAMIMDNVSCTFNNNYGMGIVNFNTNWVEVGDPTNQQDLQATGLINVGGV